MNSEEYQEIIQFLREQKYPNTVGGVQTLRNASRGGGYKQKCDGA